ncbi:MAG: aminotransferase class I/II-fold pyridoxal phosphate-dependent enzyme, partial [Planctomycetales bacterium]|nr:aminotransferase class I/II-fold pyridoxal phosphate-dependent enzyme [Planctomycetales bacterium]
MSATDAFIPWATPSYWGREREYVNDALESVWISGGPYVDRFELEFANALGVAHAITVSNGTTALHLAMLGLEIEPGDEVILPGFGFMAAANIVLHMGARPVFADVDPATWCMDPESVAAKVSNRTKAIVPIHTYGCAADLSSLRNLCMSKGIALIEDAAEALGTKFGGLQVGTVGAVGTFSFHATKTITTGEGGMVTTNDDALNERMRLFRNHGMSGRRYYHHVAGHNFRMTNLQAALGCAQLE